MAGKMCMGNDDVPSDWDLSRAYCQGRKDAFNADPLAATNPYTAGTPEADAWDRGAATWVVGGLTPMAQDCCDINGQLA